MIENGIKIINRNCIECGQLYESHEGQILGMRNPIVFGTGRCPTCSEKKLIEQEAQEAESREIEIKNKREQWRKTCGIPIRFLPERFETFKPNRTKSLKNIYNDCLDYAEKFSMGKPRGYRSIVMYSKWGVGKSHLASAIAHRVIDRWISDTDYCPVRYISEPKLFMRVRNTFNRQNIDGYHETELEVYNELTAVPLLIIDDMGKEEVSDPRFVQRVLFAIINGRYDNMLPVVITANLDVDALERHLGGDRRNSASFDRLLEMTGNVFREILATSYRDFRNRGEK